MNKKKIGVGVGDGIKLPRDHFSWSQLSLWRQSKERYRARYYASVPEVLDTRETRFGKKIAKLLEDRNFDEQPALRELVQGYDISEHALKVEMGGVRVVAYLDLFNKEKGKIREIKTGHLGKGGKAPWDAAKVIAHDQLPFYSMMVREVEGSVDPWLDLVWLETEFEKRTVEYDGHMLESDGGELKLTGRVEIFKRRIAQWEHKRIKKMIQETAREISDDYGRWIEHASEN